MRELCDSLTLYYGHPKSQQLFTSQLDVTYKTSIFQTARNIIVEHPVPTHGDDCHLIPVSTSAAKNILVLVSVAILTRF
jgi:UDP-N-acetylenolpyruvoylglucosamine reductase